MTDADGSNVLFVVLDTVRKDRLSVYDPELETTPHLAEFAEEAAVFDNAVAPAPWTLPVHASLFTGLYPSEHGATQEDPYLEGATTLAESLSAAGYDTACYSSNAWITSYTNLTAGFGDHDNFFQIMPSELLSGPLASVWKTMNDNDTLRSVADRMVQIGNKIHEHLAEGGGGDTKTPQVIDKTIDFVDDSEDFFAFINLMDAHLPYHPPEEYAEEFAPGVDSTEVCQNSKEYNCGARDIDDEEWAAIRGLYDAELAHIDDQLDRLFSHLKETGQWEDTTVVVCADHGELHGEHDLYGHEFGIYDPLVNVPLLVKHPDIDPERDAETTVELVDLYHTVLDAAGATGRGKSLDTARSLLSAEYRDFADDVGGTDRGDVGFVEYHQPVVELRQLEGKASAAGIELDEQSRFYSRMGAARTPEDKFIHCTRVPDEAYHVDTDPGETDNVADADDPAIDALRDALWAFVDEVDADWPDEADGADGDVLDEMDDDTKDRLQDLGYID
ncbi:sulfatase-like hydrolase/transferase [Haloarcula pelagica]|uniref:sulfatase-like hydrolase/transferase n=1 Tax=Haloarcula pelagica TaxID=3033389 RepID=UPI0024C33D99|nr:sulfatase-like hydrolase/transferase [Halomicroarcula sp. YJ-61-S]